MNNGKQIWKSIATLYSSRITSEWDLLVGLLQIPKCTHSNAMHDGKINRNLSLLFRCVDDGPCTHHCCKLWHIHACTDRGIDCEHCKRFVTSASSTDHDGLMLLATASEKLKNTTSDCTKADVIVLKVISHNADQMKPAIVKHQPPKHRHWTVMCNIQLGQHKQIRNQ